MTARTQPTLPSAPWPFFEQDEIDAALAVLQSGKVNYWTGEECHLFEKEYATATKCPHAVALSNGTVALELALLSLQVPAGSEVITTPRTFIASASAAVARGCVPVLADVDLNSGDITVENIAKVITPRTKAIIAVHLAGWPCDMDSIMALAQQHGLKVIEDCAQAHGATYKGRPVGSIGDAGAFSFCQDKIITTGGEGGMLTLKNEADWERAWSYKDHGKSYNAVYNRTHGPGFRWLHESFGSNWRMTEVQAAIGRRQLRKLPEWSRMRTRHALRLAEAFAKCPLVRVPLPSDDLGHAWYKMYIYIKPGRLALGWTRDRIIATITEAGVPCFSGSCSEIYREKAFTNLHLGPPEPLPNAHQLGETSLLFLVHPTLTDAHLDNTIRVTTDILNQATDHDAA